MKHINTPRVNLRYPMGRHIHDNYNDIVKMADNFLELAEKRISKVKYVCFVCTGSSGATMATIFYARTIERFPNLQIVIFQVRKEEELCHDDNSYLSSYSWHERKKVMYVMVDDFGKTGESIERCSRAIRHYRVDKFDFIVMAWIEWAAFDMIEDKKMTKNVIAHHPDK